MSAELFLEFLTETLIQKHNCPANFANELAVTIISKHKKVVDGNYALLEIYPTLNDTTKFASLNDSEQISIQNEAELRKKTQYYRRLKDNWIKDDDIDVESFLDTNTIFCNIQNKCLKNDNDVCESVSDTASRIKLRSQKQMADEFDRRITLSVTDIEKSLETQMAYHIKLISRTGILKEISLYRANNLAFEIGKKLRPNDYIISPYMKTRNQILGQSDFKKKQYDICKFVSSFCREPLINGVEENTYMFYCKDTNVELFPMSLHQLATTFVNGGDYGRKLNEIYANPNMVAKSDDGDSIVDRHSGLVIEKIALCTEDSFDENGFPTTSHAILEQNMIINDTARDITDVINSDKKLKPAFYSGLNETIYNITYAICSSIDIPINSIYENVLRISNEFIISEIKTKNAYDRITEQTIKQDKKPPVPYDTYRNENIIVIVSCVMVILIQTATPGFKTNRTYPGCVRSFSGYPLSGTSDVTGIKYIACVLYKLKSSISPWDSIKPRKIDKLTTMISNILETRIMKRPDMIELYAKKREFNILNPTLSVPDEHSITKWLHFLPPIIVTNIATGLQPIATGYHNDIINSIRKDSNHKHQIDHMQMLQGKLIKYGYGVIELINQIVKTKDLLLKTTTETPFLENACCNETTNISTPISYFIKHDKNIKIHLKSMMNLASITKNMRNISQGQYLFHDSSTKNRIINVSNGFSEEIVYNSIIHHCLFDRNLPVPESLHSVCQSKPDAYNTKWSNIEKVEFLKQSGKIYNGDSLKQLMRIINNQNIINVHSNENTDDIRAFESIINHIEHTDSDVISKSLRTHISNIIEQYTPNKMHNVPTPEHDDLSNYLITSNQQLYKIIMNYISINGHKLKNAGLDKIKILLSTIGDWKAEYTNETSFFSGVQYIKNAILMFSKIYPTIILNKSTNSNSVPSHWGLSKIHAGDIKKSINKYYEQIEPFKGDVVLSDILNEIITSLTDLNLFVQSIPIKSDIVKRDENGEDIRYFSLFDKSTTYLLLTHCLYCVLNQYINLSDNEEFLNNDIHILNVDHKEANSKLKRPTDNLQTVTFDLGVELNDRDNNLQEIQINAGTQDNLKKRICSLIIAFIEIERKNKESIDYSYDDIIYKVSRAKSRENKSFVDEFHTKDKVERNIEFTLKQFKIGRWNVGQQKGLVSYDQNTYDRERSEHINQTKHDIELGEYVDVTEMRRSIYDIELNELEQSNEEEQSELRIDGLSERFTDGGVEEEDDDDF